MPGNRAYALLADAAKRVAATGLPKLYAPTVVGSLGRRSGSRRVSRRRSPGRSSSPTHRQSRRLGSRHRLARRLDVESASASRRGSTRGRSAAPGIRVATGTLGKPDCRRRAALPDEPGRHASVIAPAADGTGGSDRRLHSRRPAARHGACPRRERRAARHGSRRARPAGQQQLHLAARELPDGRYRLAVTAASGTRSVTKAADVVVDRTLSGLAPPARDLAERRRGLRRPTLSFALTQNVPMRVDVEQRESFSRRRSRVSRGSARTRSTGTARANGAPLPTGSYIVVVTISDALGDVQLPLPLTIDTVPPVLTLLDPSQASLLTQRAGDRHGARQPASSDRAGRAAGRIHHPVHGRGHQLQPRPRMLPAT